MLFTASPPLPPKFSDEFTNRVSPDVLASSRSQTSESKKWAHDFIQSPFDADSGRVAEGLRLTKKCEESNIVRPFWPLIATRPAGRNGGRAKIIIAAITRNQVFVLIPDPERKDSVLQEYLYFDPSPQSFPPRAVYDNIERYNLRTENGERVIDAAFLKQALPNPLLDDFRSR